MSLMQVLTLKETAQYLEATERDIDKFLQQGPSNGATLVELAGTSVNRRLFTKASVWAYGGSPLSKIPMAPVQPAIDLESAASLYFGVGPMTLESMLRHHDREPFLLSSMRLVTTEALQSMLQYPICDWPDLVAGTGSQEALRLYVEQLEKRLHTLEVKVANQGSYINRNDVTKLIKVRPEFAAMLQEIADQDLGG